MKIMNLLFLLIPLALQLSTQAQDGQLTQKIDFEKYDPISTLVVPEHKPTRSKFPFVDVHNHQGSMPDQDLSKLIMDMDALNMKVMVNLSGRTGDYLKRGVNNVKTNYPNRFIVFANIEFKGIGNDGWT